jgi:hypothetical protein
VVVVVVVAATMVVNAPKRKVKVAIILSNLAQFVG